MDLTCTRCGEPWDNDCLHEEAEERAALDLPGATYAEVAREFAVKGCEALHAAYGPANQCDPATIGQQRRAEISALAFELMGDDTDGVASMMEDAEMMGLF